MRNYQKNQEISIIWKDRDEITSNHLMLQLPQKKLI